MLRLLLTLFTLLFCTYAFAQNGIIKGRVFNDISNETIPFANVIIQGSTTGASTDIDGNYEIKGLENGLYSLEVSYIGFKKKMVFDIQVSSARPQIVDIALEENSKELNEVVVKADPFSKSEDSPVSLRNIGVNEIKRSPGGNRDISIVVQSLPGVASTPTFRNDILIRGGSPAENRFYIDGIEIPAINHFATQGSSGGPVGMINVEFLKEVDFYSGAFPANRGNTLSSVFDFKFKEGRNDRMAGTIILGTSDAGITLEGPIGSKKLTYLVSVRRSYLQLLFEAIGLPFLPTYNDYQYKFKWSPNKKHSLSFISIGALDQFSLNLKANEDELQRYLLDNLPVNNQWNYSAGFKYTNFRDNSYTNVIYSRFHLNNSTIKYFQNDESSEDNLLLDYVSEEIEDKLRVENVNRINGFKITTGASYEFATYLNDTYSKISVGDQVVTIDYDSKLPLHKWGLFGQVSKTFFGERLTASAGFRADANSYSKEMSNLLDQFSPRLSLSYLLTPEIGINFNTGLYYQLPAYTVLGYRNSNGDLVNKENKVSYIACQHYVGGLEFNAIKNARITVEGFYKDYSKYPYSLKDSVSLANLGGDFGVVGDEAVTSTSSGRSYGLEFLFQQKLYKGFFGLMAYTFVRSEFENNEGKLVASSWDNRHIVSLTAGKKFKRNWEIGLKWRYTSGAPYTPFDVATSSIIPVWDVNGQGVLDYNRINSERLKAAHALDLRIDKKYFFNKWNLNVFMDVQNAYGFESEQPPILLVKRDAEGNAIINPDNPTQYETEFIDNISGFTQPSIGIIVEF